MTDLWNRFSASDLRAVVKQFGLPCTDKRRIATLREALVNANMASEALESFFSKPRSERGPAKRGVCASKPLSNSFVAIDFETANRYRNSACAISVVRVENGTIVDTYTQLIRPPTLQFEFTYIHGITEDDVRDAPTYDQIHHEVLKRIEGVDFIAAHNASFDNSVMNAICRHYELTPPSEPWRCTVRLARDTWSLYPTKLPDVCNHLGISLKHHDATSDATACAKIILAALRP